MAKIIDDETMENVCLLAKLSLEGEEREAARAEMQKMLTYVEKLDQLDTEGTEPMSHIFGSENVFREDEIVNENQKLPCCLMRQEQKTASIMCRRQ